MSTTGLLAVALTTVFYLAVVRPLQETYFGQLFAERGWVPYAISFLSFWALSLLAGKYRRLRKQSQALAVDLLPRTIGERITPANAPAFSSYVQGSARELGEGFLPDRVRRALEHFSARARVQETVELLRNQAESDEAVVESSYTMLRVFIWAIPILGFIGTVLGIGASVGGFSESVANAADLDVMKNSIGTVTAGLGVAFDTTLLALVMSVLIMFPTSSLQKAEEDFLARVEEYCGRHLIARLDDGDEPEGMTPPDEKLLQLAVARLADELASVLERRLPKAH
jgi:biopolymer transport protein ExbB/TolQ